MKYKDDAFRYLHEEMKNLHAAGDISDAELKEFELDCFKSTADTPLSRAVRTPVLASASSGPQDRSTK
jgi:DNA-binding transcriptional regulator YiaG